MAMRMDCGLESKDKFIRLHSQRSNVLETSHIAANVMFSRILAETICSVITKSIPHPFPFHEINTVPPWTDANRRQSNPSSAQEHGQRRHSQNSNQQLDAANKI